MLGMGGEGAEGEDEPPNIRGGLLPKSARILLMLLLLLGGAEGQDQGKGVLYLIYRASQKSV